jgi:XTP/dITP diphosphohydrolase
MPVEPAWRPRRLVVASGNAHKVAELDRMLRAAVPQLEVLGLRAFGDPPEVPETADDFAGNARLKAEGFAAWLRGHGEPGDTVVLADDSGVCVDALGGAPGVRSARFAGERASDEENNERLVRELQARGLEASPGHYRCVLALTRVDAEPWADAGASRSFEGRWDVELRVARRGSGGFGYDPHAWLVAGGGGATGPGADGAGGAVDQGGTPGAGAEKTVAELTPDEKAAVSHRGTALRALLAWLRTA